MHNLTFQQQQQKQQNISPSIHPQHTLQRGVHFEIKMLSLILQIPFRVFNVTTALLASACRLGAGNFAASNLDKCKRPKVPLELYEYEACPFCRKVREALCILELDCIIYPCPRETLMKQGWMSSESRFRPVVSCSVSC